MCKKIKSTDIADTINRIFGEQIAFDDNVGDIELRYTGKSKDGEEVSIDDLLFSGDTFYMYIWYSPETKTLETHSYSGDDVVIDDLDYCINNDNLDTDADYDDKNGNFYWKLEEEQIINIAEALRDFFDRTQQVLIADDDLVI